MVPGLFVFLVWQGLSPISVLLGLNCGSGLLFSVMPTGVCHVLLLHTPFLSATVWDLLLGAEPGPGKEISISSVGCVTSGLCKLWCLMSLSIKLGRWQSLPPGLGNECVLLSTGHQNFCIVTICTES